jgi:hypothetical protein
LVIYENEFVPEAEVQMEPYLKSEPYQV